MNLLKNELYIKDINLVSEFSFPWDRIENKRVLITGASGQIGSFLVDVLMNRNNKFDGNISIVAVGRNKERAHERFIDYWEDSNFVFISMDINNQFSDIQDVDYVIHAASNTHPQAYSEDPIGTIMTNIIGTSNLLNFSIQCNIKRFLFLSSVEVYGENRGDVEYFDERYFGYIDCNTLRAGYPESKRTGEALCQAYKKKYDLDFVTLRLPRIYGPTLLESDTKAISQFIKKALLNEDIVLKSEGNQYYSYSYIADAVSGLLTVLFYGESGEAYNISSDNSDIHLKNLADVVASYNNLKVIYNLPDFIEAQGYSKATKAVMSCTKLQNLGWKSNFSIHDGIKRTLDILTTSK